MLVQVHAAGLNQLDDKIRLGEFKQILPYKLQLILGNDVAGTVVRVGAKVRGFRPGDEVYGPPDPTFARDAGLNPVLRLAIAALSSKIRRQAKQLGVSYEFLFMRASGDQLREIAALVDKEILG